MEKSMSVWKRLLAVLMVFALVIGYVPVMNAAAAEVNGTVTYTEAAIPTVEITRVTNYEDVPEESSEDVPEESSEEPAPVVKDYTYTAKVTVNGAEADVADYQIVWTVGGAVVEDETGLSITNAAAEATATVTYKGLIVEATAAAEGAVSAKWAGVTAATLGTVYKGVYVNMPKSAVTNVAAAVNEVPVEVKNICTVDGVEVASSYANEKEVDETLTVVEQITVDGVAVATVTYAATVEATPVPNVTFSADPAANANGWNNSDVTVTFTAPDMDFVDCAYLPEVAVTENCGTVGTWTLENGTWTNKVTVTETATVSCNGVDHLVQIDKVIPSMQDSDTSTDWITGQKYLFISYSVGTSGLASVTVGEGKDQKVYTSSDWTTTYNGIWIQVDKKVNHNTKVVLTSNAGVSSDGSAIKDAGEMTADFTHTSILDNQNDVYVSNTDLVTVTIKNIPTQNNHSFDEGRSVVTATVNGNANQVVANSWEINGTTATATFSVPADAVYENVKVTVYKENVNWKEMEKVSEKTYINDATNPKLNVTADVDVATELYAGVATFTFSVYDEHMTKGIAALNLQYVLEVNGANQDPVSVPMEKWGTTDGKTYTTEIVVENAKLISYTVTGADNVTNALVAGENMHSTVAGESGFVYDGHKLICDTTAPTAEVTFSENVTNIYARGGLVYLQLGDAITDDSVKDDDADPVEVTVKVTFTDRNLTMANAKSNIEGDTGLWSGEPKENQDSTLVYTKTITVNEDETGVLVLDLTLSDVLDQPVEKVTVETVNGNSYPFEIPVDAGRFDLIFNIDRRRPTSTEGSEGENDTNLPEIIIENKVLPVYTAGEFELFNAAPTFSFSVNDGTPESGNSGLAKVTWELVDPNGFVIADGDEETWEIKEDKEAVYAYASEITAALNGNNESNEVTLRITVVDAGGNAISKAKTFGVDTLGPQITVKYDNNEAANGEYFQAARNVEVSVSELNYAGMEVVIDGETNAVTDKVFTDKYEEEGEHSLVVTATDLAGNAADADDVDYTGEGKNVAPEHFYIDLNNPAISVAVTGAAAVNDDAQADYHNGEVTYTFTLSDMFMQAVSAKVIFEDGTEQEIALEPTTTNEKETDMDTYVGSVTFTDGQVVSDIVVNAADKSGRTSEWKNSEKGTRKCIIVDMTAPEISVTKSSGNYVQTYGDVDYYNGEIVYTVKVTDKFLNPNVGTAQMVVTFADGVESVIDMANGTMLLAEGEESPAAKLADVDEYEIEIPVADGATLTGITLLVLDNADNVAAPVKVDDAENTEENVLTAFELKDQSWTYTGNPVVVDTVAPEATLTFSDNVETFFVRNNTVYLELTEPVEAESGAAPDAAAEVVTVTINVSDLNLAIDDVNEHGVYANDPFDWNGDTPVNQETTVTYIAESAEVKADGTAVFMIDVEVSDLAGNTLVNFKSEKAADNTTYLPVSVDEEGAIKYAFSLDRMRPTSAVSDTNAPTITIDPSIDPTKTADGLDLFSGAFKFDLNVTDGEDSNNNSGLKYVKWTINDKNGIVAAVDVTNSYENGEDVETSDEEASDAEPAAEEETAAEPVFSGAYSIDVALAGAQGRQESNEVTLNIEAMDNVGNLITYSKTFGVDAEKPEVVIETEHGLETCNVHEGIGHEYYFNEDQTIQITITDLNFDAASSPVTSIEVTNNDNVAFSGWTSQGGNVWTGSLSYTTDGDYTFNVESTDLAKHAADIEIEAYVAKFTIDKTAPVIHVNFNPFVPVDTDADMVQYFDQNRTVTVTIDEHNFRAADVKADLGAANALGAWATVGDNHTATDVFTEGNNYYVKVEYTDLAGNAAAPYNSPKFSVDLHAPEIEINKGSMSTGTLNIVPDDLILGFSITDHQDNLKNFHVEVIHLDNSYKQTKVEGVEYYSVTDGDRTTGYIDFTNIASEKANDGIYTVRVTALDYAGHQVNYPDVVFSLNRFGSTFVVNDDYTSSFLTADSTGVIYQNQVTDQLVITEINPNRVWQDADQTVEGSTITVAANGSSVTLVPGEDYEVTVTEQGNGNNKWFEYTYAINPEVFNRNDELVDGEYTLFFYSEDEAGNKNTNESNEGSELLLGADGTYSGKLTFTLDHKAPVVTVLNIEEGGHYVEANKNVEINVSDNTPVGIAVYINDELVEYVETAEGQPLNSDWITYDAASGNYVLNMCEKDEVQNVRIVVTDAAGNVYEQTIGDITLTENLWIQFINNEVLVICSVVGLIGLIILIILLLKKRKKKEEETAAV